MAPHKASQKSRNTQALGEESVDHSGKNFEVIFNKSKVQCICPNCGRKHTMNIRWIGRGVPRKFCQSCRDRETSSDFEI
jgi:transposase-like protein